MNTEKKFSNLKLKWNRVHWITPILEFWQIIFGIVAYLLFKESDAFYKLFFVSDFIYQYYIYILLSIFLFLILLFLLVYFWWIHIGYAIDDINIYYKKGIFFKKERYLRLNRIQTVDIAYPLFGRIFGLGKLNIEAAGEKESNIIIAYMKTRQLNDLRNTILALMAGVKISERKTDLNEKTVDKKLGVNDLQYFAPVAPEIVKYQLDNKKYIKVAIISRIITILIALSLIYSICFGFFLRKNLLSYIYDFNIQFILTNLSIILIFIHILIGTVYTPINELFGFELKISPDGFRVKRGLTSLKHETIPPFRIHALFLRQPLIWRIFKQWEIETVKAAYSSHEEKNFYSDGYAPMVEDKQVLNLVHLVFKKLVNNDSHIENDEKILFEGMFNSNNGTYFKKLRKIVKIFHPLQYSRMSYCITNNVILVRYGFFTRKLAIIPHERAQSFGIKQNFITEKLDLATLEIHLVQHFAGARVKCLNTQLAKEELCRLESLFGTNRLKEEKEQWMKRVYQ